MARIRHVGGTIAFGLVLLAIAGLLIWVLDRQADGAQQRAEQAVAISSLADSLAQANDRLEAAGEKPVPVPDAPDEPIQGVQGEPGRPPSPAEISLAVESHCMVRNDCVGPSGKDGSNGQDGKAGLNGANGKDGVDGKSIKGDKGDKGDPGEPGPPPTNEQVLAAVSAFCATNNNCMGPPGQNGMTGANGLPGVSVTNVACQEDGTWLISYSDGGSSTTPGPCRVSILP